VLPPEPPKETTPDGQTKDGVPFAQRGGLLLDSAAYLDSEGRGRGASFELRATIPLGARTFLEGIVPVSLIQPLGNVTFGAHHVGKLGRSTWLTAGGSMGVPLVADGRVLAGAVPRGYWGMHRYVEDTLPIQAFLLFETHVAEIVAIRVHAEPSLWFPIGDADSTDGAFYHAAELQIGHAIGGGVRMQGVVVGPGRDNYQLALGPFFYAQRDPIFLRAGLLLPVDEELGPPFKRSWGLLVAVGLHVD
jgi:hypothetical protein